MLVVLTTIFSNKKKNLVHTLHPCALDFVFKSLNNFSFMFEGLKGTIKLSLKSIYGCSKNYGLMWW